MADERSPLESEIRRLIAAAGPMPVADYMRLCLTHPNMDITRARPDRRRRRFHHRARDQPDVRRAIGLWMAAVWQQMGAPDNVRIVELGPGRGTLHGRRGARGENGQGLPYAHGAASGRGQPEAARDAAAAVGRNRFADPVASRARRCPGRPIIIVANEFIDALPIHQAVKTSRRVARAHRRNRAPTAILPSVSRVIRCRISRQRCREQCGRLRKARSTNGGLTPWRSNSVAGCGPAASLSSSTTATPGSGLGETLQALAGHAFVDPLAAPGKADMTAHVDFAALAQSAEIIGASAHGPLSQREFLGRLGIDKRAAALKSRASREGFRDRLAHSRAHRGRTKRHGRIFQGTRACRPGSVRCRALD